MAERLIRLREARKILGVGQTTFDLLVERGLLPIVRFTERSARVRESALSELIERCEAGRQSAGGPDAA